jgi:hypothetical protein
MALALGKLNFSCAVIGLTCMLTKPEPLNLGVPVVNFPRANVILARAQALLCMGTRLGFGRHEASHRLSEVRELRDACAEGANSTPPCMHVNS